MSRSSVKKSVEHEAQPQLYFDSKRDINPYWKSSLFSDVYLKNDIPREYKNLWENDEIGDFNNFYQGFLDLCTATQHLCFEKLREADTVKDWIVPVMTLLGWENNSERHQNSYMDNESFTLYENGRKQTFRPDLIYFEKPAHKSYTQKEKDFEKKLLEVRNKKTGAKIIVEAKYWDRLAHQKELTARESNAGDSASALGPELQTLKYMEMFDHEFGILTDGKTWKLFHKELSQGLDQRSYDFDLGNLRELALDIGTYGKEEEFRHYAKYFYFFYSKKSLIQSDDVKTPPFVYEVFEYSKKYSHSIEDDLKKRFVITMGITCNALQDSCQKEGSKTLDLDLIRNVSESHLFNFLFVKSCEVRRILPIKSTKYLRKSLHEVVETMDAMGFDPNKEWDDYLRDFRHTLGASFDWDGYEIFNRFIDLYEVIHDGTANSKDFGFEISGFKESIFSSDEWKFAKKHKINNRSMVKILFHLNFIESSFKGRKYQQIPYSYFTARQLGSIYESFLEFKLEVAATDMIFTKNQWSVANLKSTKVKGLNLTDHHTVRKGELFFSPDNSERKITGSYYTPNYIVKEIVESALGPLCESKTSSEILELRICDPAMGSGHFLSGALDFLVEQYRKKWSDEHQDDVRDSVSETSRMILDKCIFGVDLNPRAVKLAKMSLWLLTSHPGKKLERLDDQLKSGNSIISNLPGYKSSFDWKKEFPNVMKSGGFHCVIGNPPYGSYFSDNIKNYIFKSYKFINKRLDVYSLFVEMIPGILRENDGVVGIIIPSTFLFLEGFQELRKFYLDSFGSFKIFDFKYQVFDSANVDTSIVVASKAGRQFKYKRCVRQSDVFHSTFEELESDAIRENEMTMFKIENHNSILDGLKWVMGDIFDICTGVKPYQVGKGDPVQDATVGNEKLYNSTRRIDKSYLKYLYGRDIGQFHINWKTGEFVKYGKNLAEPKEDRFHKQERLFIQRIRNPKLKQRIVACYTDDEFIASAGLSIVVPKKKKSKEVNYSEISLKALCVYLNLPTVNEWYSYLSNDVNVKPTTLRKIPVDLELIKIGGELHCSFDVLASYARDDKEDLIRKKLQDLDKIFVKPVKRKKAA